MSAGSICFTVGDAAFFRLEGLDFEGLIGPDITAIEPCAERADPRCRDLQAKAPLPL